MKSFPIHNMEYYLYCSSGNVVGVEEYIGYFEIGVDGCCTRYLEIQASGMAIRYTEDHESDKFGALPEGRWSDNATELGKPEYGALKAISRDLFEATWRSTQCRNIDKDE
jgi:hypothetical protein